MKDEDFRIDSDSLATSKSESVDESKSDNEDFARENPTEKKKPNINILQDIQISKPDVNPSQVIKSIASHMKERKLMKTRLVKCIFCAEDTISKNFMRHLMRRHSDVKEVRQILNEPLHSKGRKHAIAALR